MSGKWQTVATHPGRVPKLIAEPALARQCCQPGPSSTRPLAVMAFPGRGGPCRHGRDRRVPGRIGGEQDPHRLARERGTGGAEWWP
jgi:hypothetical protein